MNDKAVFAGDLSVISLPEVFQMLDGNHSTGILRMKSQYAAAPGFIYFVDGSPINAANGPLRGAEAIYALFGWTEGKFEFQQQKVQVKRVVHNSPMNIILDALRMLDDGIIKKVGPPSLEEVTGAQGGGQKQMGSGALPVIKGFPVDYRYVIDEEAFHDGDKIVTEGGYGSWFWVILDGTVGISRRTSAGSVTMLKLGEGCFVGSLASFSFASNVRDTTATAEGNVELGVLDLERLSREHASMSPDFRGLLLSLDGRLRKITDRAIDVFVGKKGADGLTGSEAVVVKEGSSTKDVYSISEGEAYVMRKTKKGYLPLVTLEKGDIFGHMPFMDIGHEPRRASVLASKDLDVAKLNMASLQKEYSGLSGTFRTLVNTVAACVFVTTKLACRVKGRK